MIGDIDENGKSGDNDDIEVNDDNEVIETDDIEEEDLTSTAVLDEEDLTSTAVLDHDNVGDMSVEINVEELVAKIETSDSEEVAHRAEVRKKLEDAREQRDKELDSTYNFNIDDDS